MLSFFRQSLSVATVLQLAVETSWLFLAGVLVMRFSDGHAVPTLSVVTPALVFAVLMVVLNGIFGLYRRSDKLSTGAYVLRVLLALVIAVMIAYASAEMLPGGEHLQEKIGLAVLFAVGGLLLVRHVIVLPLVGNLLPYRVLVLGTGPEARIVEASLAAARPSGMRLAGFFPLDKVVDTAVSPRRVITGGGTLEETVGRLGINEIIVAVRQQRGGVLPLRALLDCRLNGVRVTDLARFFERVYGKVPIESLKVSWLIYGDGYRQSWVRAACKRAFDVVVSLALLMLTLPVMAVVAVMIAMESDGPVIYRQERVGLRGKKFVLLKFRSMGNDAEKDGKASWAAVNDSRVTGVGRMIRRTRIDELPQLVNVLRGEMSFVGPRPERPQFVSMLTEKIPFYAVRHSVKPGVTGWAQVRYSYGATVEQTEKKLEYDLYYVKNHTLLLDMLILLETIRVVLLGEGAR